MPVVASHVVRRSGRKLGNVRDARTAHAMHVAYEPERARTIREYGKAYDLWIEDEDNPCPEYPDLVPPVLAGWQVLGTGCSRTAYLSPKGVVYKVNRDLSDGEYKSNSNYAEMHNIVRIKGGVLPKGWAVPDATLYHIPTPATVPSYRRNDYVIAMPLVDTSKPLASCYGYDCDSNGCNSAEGNLRAGGGCTESILDSGARVFGDRHNENVFPDEHGVLWVVDIGIARG